MLRKWWGRLLLRRQSIRRAQNSSGRWERTPPCWQNCFSSSFSTGVPCVISLDWFDELQETLATPCNPIGEVIQLIAQWRSSKTFGPSIVWSVLGQWARGGLPDVSMSGTDNWKVCCKANFYLTGLPWSTNDRLRMIGHTLQEQKCVPKLTLFCVW